MYNWREMTEDQRAYVLQLRKLRKAPWHGPPHWSFNDPTTCMVTAACYEHAAHLGMDPDRIDGFASALLQLFGGDDVEVSAWVVLPNHYHVLARARDWHGLLQGIGRLHGRTSRRWNLEGNCVGRKVWHRTAETQMKSERHFWATVNYIHNNPVRHGYVTHWQDWVWSSAGEFLDAVGRDRALELWQEYPVGDYGRDWDW